MMTMTTALAALGAASGAVGCSGSAKEEAVGPTEAASSGKPPVALDVGAEARDLEVMTAGRFSLANSFVLAQVSDAAYESSKPPSERGLMTDLLCDAGMEADGLPCKTGGPREKVAVIPFDTEDGDNHAIYIQHPRFGIVAFRGTASARNWLSNVALSPVPFVEFGKGNRANGMEVHGGFDAAARRVLDTVLPGRSQSMRAFLLERHRRSGSRPLPPPLYVTGHSLGGAMATIAVASLLMSECSAFAPEERFRTPRADAAAGELRWSLPGTRCPAESQLNLAALYTFGSPRVGKKQFAEATSNLMALRHVTHWRVVHEEDIVSLVPPRALGFSHLHLDIQGVPERRAGLSFDLREGEEVELDALPVVNGRRACGQKREEPGLPEVCPISSWVFLIPDPKDRKIEERRLSEIVRVGVGAKMFLDKEEEANRAGGASVSDHKMEGYEGVLGRLARRDKPVITPPRACEDAADALAAAVPRCGGDPDAAREAFLRAAAGGTCKNVTSVRDAASFYGTCLPYFRTVSCEDMLAARYPPECVAQLERPR